MASANARFATMRANLRPAEGRSTTTRTPTPPNWASSGGHAALLTVRRQTPVAVDRHQVDTTGHLGQQPRQPRPTNAEVSGLP